MNGKGALMRTQEIRYEIVEEDNKGFDPCCLTFDSLAEAEQELANYRQSWPGSNAFIVRTTMTRVSKENETLPLQTV